MEDCIPRNHHMFHNSQRVKSQEMEEKAPRRSLEKGGVVLHPTVKQKKEALVTFEVSGRRQFGTVRQSRHKQ